MPFIRHFRHGPDNTLYRHFINCDTDEVHLLQRGSDDVLVIYDANAVARTPEGALGNFYLENVGSQRLWVFSENPLRTRLVCDCTGPESLLDAEVLISKRFLDARLAKIVDHEGADCD
jgi:hypothetical protein